LNQKTENPHLSVKNQTNMSSVSRKTTGGKRFFAENDAVGY